MILVVTFSPHFLKRRGMKGEKERKQCSPSHRAARHKSMNSLGLIYFWRPPGAFEDGITKRTRKGTKKLKRRTERARSYREEIENR